MSFLSSMTRRVTPPRAVLVADLADALQHPGVRQLGDLLLDLLHRGLVRDLADDDAVASRALLDLGGGAHLDRATAGAERRDEPGAPHDLRAGREVGALDELHQVVRGGVGVVEQVDGRVDHLAEVVRGDVGRHADRDPLAAVDQQVREPTGQDRRLVARPVEVRREVDRLLVDAREHVHGERRQPALGVAIGRRRVRRGPEVPVGVDQRVAQREVLAHADQRVVDGLVAVGVVLAQDVTDHGGALLVVAVGTQPGLVHRPQDPTVHRLEPVTCVGERSRHDDRHRVVQEGLLHLLLDLDRFDRAGAHRHIGEVLARLVLVGCSGSVVAHWSISLISVLGESSGVLTQISGPSCRSA